jgi:hypothetical protein
VFLESEILRSLICKRFVTVIVMVVLSIHLLESPTLGGPIHGLNDTDFRIWFRRRVVLLLECRMLHLERFRGVMTRGSKFFGSFLTLRTALRAALFLYGWHRFSPRVCTTRIHLMIR